MRSEVDRSIELLHVIRTGYICDPQGRGLEKNGDVCSIFKCDDFHEALAMAIEALEKQRPKKPIRILVKPTYHTYFRKTFEMYTCPVCHKAVEVDDNEGYQTEFYPSCECGQRIDWTGILEDYELKWNDYEVVE